MRKISLVLVVAMLLFVGNTFANNTVEDKPGKKLVTQIAKLLSKNTLTSKDVDATAQVRFTVNKESEIVVLSVSTNNYRLEGFVKGNLNYKKVALEEYTEGKIYTMPVRIKS